MHEFQRNFCHCRMRTKLQEFCGISCCLGGGLWCSPASGFDMMFLFAGGKIIIILFLLSFCKMHMLFERRFSSPRFRERAFSCATTCSCYLCSVVACLPPNASGTGCSRDRRSAGGFIQRQDGALDQGNRDGDDQPPRRTGLSNNHRRITVDRRDRSSE